MRRSISLIHDLWCLILLIVLFLKKKPEIIHGNTPKASMLTLLAGWLTRRPIRIYMCHGLRYESTHGLLKKLLIVIEKLTCYCATNVIVVSNGLKDKMISQRICSQNKATVVGHGSAGGIDLNYFNRDSVSKLEIDSIKKKHGIKGDDFVFIFIGRIVKDKGIEELINAYIRIYDDNKKVHLILLGDNDNNINPISKETTHLIQTNNNIHFVGHKSDIRPYLLASNALVLPSYREGFGMVLLEANALNIPCIATDITGCNEIIIPNINGELVPSHDSSLLYLKMREWTVSREKVKLMANQCRDSISKRYNRDIVILNYLKYYKALYNKFIYQ